MSIPDKFKVRISRFTYLTIIHDCLTFKCVKNDGTANVSKFINTLLPTLMTKRSSLHKKIRHKLYDSKLIKPVSNKDADLLLGELETILDVPISIDYLLDELSEELWIRPNKETYKLFEKIWNSELIKYNLDFSQYIRYLLNDYCSLQQFKREELFFYKILETVRKTSVIKSAIEVKICNEYKIIIPIEFYSDYLKTDMTYLFYAIDWDDKKIYASNLIDIDVIDLCDTTFKPKQKQIKKVYELIDKRVDINNEDSFLV